MLKRRNVLRLRRRRWNGERFSGPSASRLSAPARQPCALPAISLQNTGRHRQNKRRKGAGGGAAEGGGKGRDWILKKKESMRNKGYMAIPRDTKYTGRKCKGGA